MASVLATAVAAGNGPDPSIGTNPIVTGYQGELRSQIADGPDESVRLKRLHQLRNAEAMVELVSALPPDGRPGRILYLASGIHLAPLALCELLPEESPCTIVLTEIDGTIAKDVSALLEELARTGRLSDLRSEHDDDGFSWRFRMADRPIHIELVLANGERLIDPALLRETDLVISHDWSGDPLGNLTVVHDVLLAVRSSDGGPPPMLMIEDLERHPYPIDMTFFTPVARTSLPYGHRASERGTGFHGDIELGEPLFGGGVLLDFSDSWWRDVDRETLDGVFDLLLFNEFDAERQNVLVGGDDPLLAPALLDWYAAFGLRTIAGGNLDTSAGSRSEIMATAARALPAMNPDSRHRLSCRLQLYRCLLQARAAGADIRKEMPSASSSRGAGPGDFPTETMETMYREALRHAGDYRRSKDAERAEAAQTIETTEPQPLLDALASCPVAEPGPDDDPATYWLGVYERLAEELAPW